METVQLQCGQCQKLMAISVEHLGGQVQCPHCRTVVQTPPAAKSNSATSPLSTLSPHNERDSIFAGPDASEDVVGGGAVSAKVERKPSTHRAPATMEAAPPPEAPPPSAETTPDPETDLTSFKRRPLYDKSMVSLIAMMFLVPYSIMTTLFVVYLLYQSSTKPPHPLDFIHDPVPSSKKGGPQRITKHEQPVHNLALAAHQLTSLKQSIQLGDLKITPQQIRLTKRGELQLVMRAKNVSANTAFEPINDFYVLYTPSREAEGEAVKKPYTFLESKTQSIKPVFGGFLDYYKLVEDKETPTSDRVLSPRDEVLIVISTMDNYRSHVVNIARSNDDYLWRVQVRRGFVHYRNKDIPVTTVFGVEFNAKQIERET